ncbi:hypothetical protein [Pediococcus pentosaceus]|uniref:hypothetical protein n=1 Tax=Pediococcus pentosaceus TaxID=1255 RepID=UPI0018A16B36|nr:hypothetical protein [Pediococcus pentosaceus]MBF7137250.1 hypothetical protein [Pediococcus pentosaceus]
MEDFYIVRLGNLYVEKLVDGFAGQKVYRMTNFISGARIFGDDFSKKIAEEIGGKAYKINLEEVE